MQGGERSHGSDAHHPACDQAYLVGLQAGGGNCIRSELTDEQHIVLES